MPRKESALLKERKQTAFREFVRVVRSFGAKLAEDAVYVRSGAPVHIICAEGHDCYPTPNNVQRGQGICRVCGPAQGRRTWTARDDELLRSMLADGYTSTAIAKVVGRSASSVAQRKRVLGLSALKAKPEPREVGSVLGVDGNYTVIAYVGERRIGSSLYYTYDLKDRRCGHVSRWEGRYSSTVSVHKLCGCPSRYVDPDGYVMWYWRRPDGKTSMVPEHRIVLEREIGRELLPHESAHHKNGQRDDNRPENLELWSKAQPAGQRVEDKVTWAVELLKLYAPELLKETSVCDSQRTPYDPVKSVAKASPEPVEAVWLTEEVHLCQPSAV